MERNKLVVVVATRRLVKVANVADNAMANSCCLRLRVGSGRLALKSGGSIWKVWG